VVRLPLLSSPPGLPARATPAPAGPSRRILVIQDHADSRESLCLLLEQWGHGVDEAAGGIRGLERLLATCPDVALVDIGLPGRDGYSVARAARSAAGGERLCLVALTGYGQPEDRRRAEEAGFDTHLVKPIDEERLLDVLAALPRPPDGPPRPS